MTMTKKTFSHAEKTYTAPICTTSEINLEGVLCSSFGGTVEKLGNSIEYIWGEEEE